MNCKLVQEIQLRLRAPIVFFEKTIQGRRLPHIFAQASYEELRKVQKLVEKLGRKK